VLLVGPFLPGGVFNRRWKSPQRDVRLRAVASTRNDDLLFRMATDDEDLEVRSRAAGKIRNQESLSRLVVEADDLDVKRSALRQMQDESRLKTLVNECPDGELREDVRSRLESVRSSRAHIDYQKWKDQVERERRLLAGIIDVGR
jgi:hypothetical protein